MNYGKVFVKEKVAILQKNPLQRKSHHIAPFTNAFSALKFKEAERLT